MGDWRISNSKYYYLRRLRAKCRRRTAGSHGVIELIIALMMTHLTIAPVTARRPTVIGQGKQFQKEKQFHFILFFSIIADVNAPFDFYRLPAKRFFKYRNHKYTLISRNYFICNRNRSKPPNSSVNNNLI